MDFARCAALHQTQDGLEGGRRAAHVDAGGNLREGTAESAAHEGGWAGANGAVVVDEGGFGEDVVVIAAEAGGLREGLFDIAPGRPQRRDLVRADARAQ